MNVERIPRTHTNATAASETAAVCNVYISSVQRQSELITLQFLLALSLSLWVERQVHSQLYHPSLEVDPLKGEEGVEAFGRMLKDMFILSCLKGRMQFGPADVKEL